MSTALAWALLVSSQAAVGPCSAAVALAQPLTDLVWPFYEACVPDMGLHAEMADVPAVCTVLGHRGGCHAAGGSTFV
jgi:hypothetical protein